MLPIADPSDLLLRFGGGRLRSVLYSGAGSRMQGRGDGAAVKQASPEPQLVGDDRSNPVG